MKTSSDALYQSDRVFYAGVDVPFIKELAATIKSQNFITGSVSKLDLTDVQIDFLDRVNNYRKVICLKSRQIFITTACLLYILARVLIEPGLRVALVLHTSAAAIEKLHILADWMGQLGVGLKRETQAEIELRNGSVIRAISASTEETAGRGKTYNLLVFSEMAFYPNAALTWHSIMPARAAGAQVIVESTSQGPLGYFHQLWTSPNDWHKKFYSLEEQPNYVENPLSIPETIWNVYQDKGFTSRAHAAFFHHQLVNDYLNDEPRLKQNYPLSEEDAWVSVDGAFITKAPKILPSYERYGFHIFKDPVANERYLWGYDPSGSKGRDHSAIAIINRYTNELVASFYDNRMEADEVLNRIALMAKVYPPDMIIIEENGVGENLIPFARKLHLPIQTSYTDEEKKYINFLSCKRLIEAGQLMGDENLKNEAVSLTRKANRETGRPKFYNADDLLTACGLAITYNLNSKIQRPRPMPDPERYYPSTHSGPKSRVKPDRHLI